jgi:hypothetical protein
MMRATAAQQLTETKTRKAPSIRTPNYIYNIADAGEKRNYKVVKRMSRTYARAKPAPTYDIILSLSCVHIYKTLPVLT